MHWIKQRVDVQSNLLRGAQPKFEFNLGACLARHGDVATLKRNFVSKTPARLKRPWFFYTPWYLTRNEPIWKTRKSIHAWQFVRINTGYRRRNTTKKSGQMTLGQNELYGGKTFFSIEKGHRFPYQLDSFLFGHSIKILTEHFTCTQARA